MATVRDVCSSIFQKLVAGTNLELAKYPKVRVYLSREEHNALASQIKILSTYVFNKDICFVLLDYAADAYFLTIGIENEISTTNVVACENVKELSMISISESQISRLQTMTESTLINNIFVDSNVENVEWSTIEPFFPSVMTYKVNNPVGPSLEERNAALKHLVLYALVCSPEILILPFDKQTLQEYDNLLNIGDKNIPEDNLIHSLASNYWRFCYFDIYRCIERLYVLGWVHNFKTNLASSLPIADLHSVLKEKYNIKAGVEIHENTNIEYLFSLLPPSINNILDPVRNGKRQDNYIYHLRNIIVHFQKNEAELESITDTQWNIIIRFLLSAIRYLYPMFGTYINALPDE
ncbi:hypothetical protein SAMN04487901_106147 [Prevotella communis]|uniref:Uncharacterized protein n=1 Tax=Prevotella communis TaxID=2913614 RepID=A0A1G7VV40_9BACT|nr:hypothetical protein [Prevotella communis]SDG63557.1 hypothetical protein SAMN04487901_106147 [Prevotella communis]